MPTPAAMPTIPAWVLLFLLCRSSPDTEDDGIADGPSAARGGSAATGSEGAAKRRER